MGQSNPSLAFFRNALIINEAGEGNRSLVSKAVLSGVKLFAPLGAKRCRGSRGASKSACKTHRADIKVMNCDRVPQYQRLLGIDLNGLPKPESLPGR